MSSSSSDGRREQVSAEEFFYAGFYSLLKEGSVKLFDSGKFSDCSDAFRLKFEYEFDCFALWTVLHFSKHRYEFESVSQLSEKSCRALLRALGDGYDVSPLELERLYEAAIVRFKDMDSDMQSDGGLLNVSVGIAERISPESTGEDFFACVALTTDFFTALIERHATALERIELLN